VLTFALEREAEGIVLDTVGIVLMIVGSVGRAACGSARRGTRTPISLWRLGHRHQ
jgi:hypothetical protein